MKIESAKQKQASDWRLGIAEKIFNSLMSNAAILMIILLSGIFITLLYSSIPSIKQSGLGFIYGRVWDPVTNQFGGLSFLVGTIITTFLALIISFPFSISLGLILGEYFKKGIVSEIFKNIIELMAGVPSVIYGFGALYFLVPAIRHIETHLGVPAYGVGILTASIVLAIMIVPYWASVAREVINLAPNDLKEASYALGATRFELIRYIILPFTRSGILAGMMLALGRALGETMAVTMVIGNNNVLPKGIFDPSNTMASVIANEFTEATSDLYLSALIEIALLLFVVSLIFNLLGRQIIKRMASR